MPVVYSYHTTTKQASTSSSTLRRQSAAAAKGDLDGLLVSHRVYPADAGIMGSISTTRVAALLLLLGAALATVPGRPTVMEVRNGWGARGQGVSVASANQAGAQDSYGYNDYGVEEKEVSRAFSRRHQKRLWVVALRYVWSNQHRSCQHTHFRQPCNLFCIVHVYCRSACRR